MSSVKKDLTGMQFQRWRVISEAGRKNGGVTWNCICECGTEKELLLEVLTEGDPTLYTQAKGIVEKAKKELGVE